MKKYTLFYVAFLFVYSVNMAWPSGTWTFLDLPVGPTDNVYPQGIDGDDIVGSINASSRSGFLYNYVTKEYRIFSIGKFGVFLYGINNGNIVGRGFDDSSINHAFIAFNRGTSFKYFDVPWNNFGMSATAISNKNIVGYFSPYSDAATKGFLYTVSDANWTTGTWTTMLIPGETDEALYPWGIDGNTVVGYWYANPLSSGFHGFSYDIKTHVYTKINVPSSMGTSTRIYGIKNNIMVGNYEDINTHRLRGFIYDRLRDSWTAVDAPLAVNGTSLRAITGDDVAGYKIVGDYSDSQSIAHGFVYSIRRANSAVMWLNYP